VARLAAGAELAAVGEPLRGGGGGRLRPPLVVLAVEAGAPASARATLMRLTKPDGRNQTLRKPRRRDGRGDATRALDPSETRRVG
jgi:hypothetical protein